MKMTSSTKFSPIEITLTIESEEEVKALKALCKNSLVASEHNRKFFDYLTTHLQNQ